MMLAIIDADSIVYGGACSAERRYYSIDSNTGIEFKYKKEAVQYCNDNNLPETEIELCYEISPFWIAKSNIEKSIFKILEQTEASDYIMYISSPKPCFRYEIDTEYKSNRKELRRPVYVDLLREYLIDTWECKVSDEGLEADDSVCIKAWELYNTDEEYIICHIDKDLDQIPGVHYNYRNGDIYFLDELTCEYNFYIQVLMGDTIDGIKSPKGIGKSKARNVLHGYRSAEELRQKALKVYTDHYGEEEGERRFKINCELLYLKRK